MVELVLQRGCCNTHYHQFVCQVFKFIAAMFGEIVILHHSSVASRCKFEQRGGVDDESLAESEVEQSLYKHGQTHRGPER